jgi:uncharacterized membrane protein YhaH (DUF805 family)
MDFWQSVASGFRNYAEFTGRARRSEFWWWVLFTTLVNAALNTIPLGILGWGGVSPGALSGLWTVVILVPTVALAVRRLRDAGIGWGHVFWLFLPVAGLVVLAILAAQPSRAEVGPTRATPASVGAH